MSFKPLADADRLCFLLGDMEGRTLLVEQHDATGKTLLSVPVTEAYAEIEVSPSAHEVVLSGNADIFEIITKKK